MGKLDDLFHVGENLSGEAFRNFMCKYNGKLFFIWVVHLHLVMIGSKYECKLEDRDEPLNKKYSPHTNVPIYFFRNC